MPEAPLQRDFSRRRTPQDRPFVWSGDSVRNLVPRVQEKDCPTHCAQECLQRGPVTFLGQPAAYRFAFDFDSSHAFYSEFAGTVILTWDEAGLWVSDESDIVCDGSAGPSRFRWVLESPTGSLAAGSVRLHLQQVPTTPTNYPCADFPIGMYYWMNVYDFDPLCPNLFRPASASDISAPTATRAHMAIYDGTQSCVICVEPVNIIHQLETVCADDPNATYPLDVPDIMLLEADIDDADCHCGAPWQLDDFQGQAIDFQQVPCVFIDGAEIGSGTEYTHGVQRTAVGPAAPSDTYRITACGGEKGVQGLISVLCSGSRDPVTWKIYKLRAVVLVVDYGAGLGWSSGGQYESDWIDWNQLQGLFTNGGTLTQYGYVEGVNGPVCQNGTTPTDETDDKFADTLNFYPL